MDESEVYGTFLQTPFSSNSTPKSVGDQIKGANERALEHFKDFEMIPSIMAETVNANEDVQFTAVIPSYTALYSDNPDFFATLGFQPNTFTDISSMVGHLKVMPAGTPSYGFFNVSPGIIKIKSSIHLKAQPMDVYYEAVMKGDQIKGQFRLEYRFFTDWLFMHTLDKRPFNRVAAVQALADLVEDGLDTLSLKKSLIQVESDGTDGILIQSTETPGSKVEIIFWFEEKLAHFLNLEEEAKLTFPLFDHRKIILKTAEDMAEGEVMMRHRFPVILVLHGGQADADNYIEGVGKASMLGLMLDTDTILGEGVIFTGQSQELKISLLDSNRKPLKHKSSTEYTLFLQIHQF